MENRTTTMKKPILTVLLLFFYVMTFAQEIPKNESEARNLIENATTNRINKDWSQMAEFRSGIGETVQFYPVQIVDLKTGKKTNALQVDIALKIKNNQLAAIQSMGTGNSANVISAFINDEAFSAWVDLDEIAEFITFIEQHIAPNLDLRFKDKSSEFIFNAKEITIKYLVDEKRRRLSIILNQLEKNGIPFYFWTEARVDKITDLLPMLKSIKNKELKF